MNFQELICIGTQDPSTYDFEDYQDNNLRHTPIAGCCVSCEEKRCNRASDDEMYKLTNISHGARSSDFFLAQKDKLDVSAWHAEPIVFVYETPSLDYDIYKEVENRGYSKRPSKDWYWVHDELHATSYPQNFGGGKYGKFVLSAIMMFKLSNAYMTNLVKCGMNNDQGKSKGLGSYSEETVLNCYSRFLSKELSAMKPRIIFAMGTAVEQRVRNYVKDSYYVQQLPHPAGRRRGFRDEHYKAIYFWGIARALHKAGIITTKEGSDLAKLYLDNY